MNDSPTPVQLLAQVNAGLAIREEASKLKKAIGQVKDLRERLRPLHIERMRALREIEKEMAQVDALERSLARRLKMAGG